MGRNSPKFSKQSISTATSQQQPPHHQRKRRGPRSKLSRDAPSKAPHELFIDGYEVTLASVTDKSAIRAGANQAQTAAAPKGESPQAAQAYLKARHHHVNPEAVPHHSDSTSPKVQGQEKAQGVISDPE